MDRRLALLFRDLEKESREVQRREIRVLHLGRSKTQGYTWGCVLFCIGKIERVVLSAICNFSL